MSNEWKLEVVLSIKLSNWEKRPIFFRPKRFHRVSLIRYCKKEKCKRDFYSCYFFIFDIYKYMVNIIQKIVEVVFLTQLNVPKYFNVVAYMKSKLTWIFVLSVNPMLFWTCSSNMGTQTLVLIKIFLSLSLFSLD